MVGSNRHIGALSGCLGGYLCAFVLEESALLQGVAVSLAFTFLPSGLGIIAYLVARNWRE